MGIMGVLFNPSGRIQANQFWQGVIVIVAYIIVVNVLGGYLPAIIGMILGISMYLLPYPYLCVYGKRLHDNGKTAWLFLIMFLIFIIGILFVVSSTPGFSEFTARYMELAAEQDQEGLEALIGELSEGEMANAIGMRALLYLVGINLLFGFLLARLHSDPHTNKHGPPVGGEAVSGPEDNDIFS